MVLELEISLFSEQSCEVPVSFFGSFCSIFIFLRCTSCIDTRPDHLLGKFRIVLGKFDSLFDRNFISVIVGEPAQIFGILNGLSSGVYLLLSAGLLLADLLGRNIVERGLWLGLLGGLAPSS